MQHIHEAIVGATVGATGCADGCGKLSGNVNQPLIFAQLHSLISLTRLLKGFQMEEEIEDDLLFQLPRQHALL